MENEKVNYYLPTYLGILPCCGNEMACEIIGKYPDATERVSCGKCKAEFNARFLPNENGVVTLELRPVPTAST